MKKVVTLGLIATLFSAQAFAVVENNKTITTFALNDSLGNGYFGVAEPLTQPCSFGVIMFSGNSFCQSCLQQKWPERKYHC